LLHSFSPGMTIPPGWEIASWAAGSILIAIALIRTLCAAKDATGDRPAPDLSLTAYTFVLVCSFSVLAHAFFGVDYLRDRFAMFLLPLFLLSALHAIAGFRHSLIRQLVPAIAVVAAVCSWISMQSHFGPEESVQWHYDMTTKDAMGTIKADMERNHVADRTLKIGNNWLFEPTINFYRTIWKIDHLARADRKGPKGDDDYRIVFAGDPVQLDTTRFDTLAYFSLTDVLVMRRASLQ